MLLAPASFPEEKWVKASDGDVKVAKKMRFPNPLLLASFGVLFAAASCTLITDVDRSKIPDGEQGGGVPGSAGDSSISEGGSGATGGSSGSGGTAAAGTGGAPDSGGMGGTPGSDGGGAGGAAPPMGGAPSAGAPADAGAGGA